MCKICYSVEKNNIATEVLRHDNEIHQIIYFSISINADNQAIFPGTLQQ